MSSMPFKMGVTGHAIDVVPPLAMYHKVNLEHTDTEGNETQDMTMNEMIQQMMMSGNGSNGMDSIMTEDDSQELQNAMTMNNMTDSEEELN